MAGTDVSRRQGGSRKWFPSGDTGEAAGRRTGPVVSVPDCASGEKPVRYEGGEPPLTV